MWHCPRARQPATSPTHRLRRRGVRRSASVLRGRPQAEFLEGRALLSSIVEYPLPTSSSVPAAITEGPGGEVWFVTQGSNAIGSIDPVTHAISTTPIPTAAAYAAGIAEGSDGKVWFTEERVGQIGVLDPTTGTIREIPTPTPDSDPYGITAGPDGNLWFTELGSGKIGMIDPKTGGITEFATPTQHSEPDAIAVGPDGNLWFTEFAADRIGSINPRTDAIAEFTLPTASSQPQGITAGPDGNLWFAEFGVNRIGMINTSTDAITDLSTPTTSARPWGITAGPDGNIWFSEQGSGQIGAIDPTTQQITELALPTSDSAPTEMAACSDGNVWFLESGKGSLGVVMLATNNPVADPPSSGTGGGPGAGQPSPAIPGTTSGSAVANSSTTSAPGEPTAAAPELVGEQVVRTGKGRRAHVVGFQLDFSEPLNVTAAQDSANYTVVEQAKHGRKLVSHPLAFHAVYDASSRSVRLILAGRPKFARGGRIVVAPNSSGTIAAVASARITGADGGNPMATVSLVILPGARGVVA